VSHIELPTILPHHPPMTTIKLDSRSEMDKPNQVGDITYTFTKSTSPILSVLYLRMGI